MSSANPAEDIIRDRAAYWAARLNDSDVSDAERAELHDWLLADPRHSCEFRAHHALIGMAREFPSDLRDRLTGYAPSYREESQPSGWGRARRPFAMVAALLVALVAGGWFMTRSPVTDIYSTRTGESRTVKFEDGTVVHLNTRTRLEWLGDKRERRLRLADHGERCVRLVQGEALFDVVYDPSYPFCVLLDHSKIEVLGTRFNVYRKSNGEVIVTVLEGKVAVKELGEKMGDRPTWQREVGANQQIVYRQVGLMSDVHETTAADAVAWLDGVLVIQGKQFAEVVDELNRYTDQRLVIRDPRIANYFVGGAQDRVSVRDTRVALERLKKVVPLRVVESDGTFKLDYRTE